MFDRRPTAGPVTDRFGDRGYVPGLGNLGFHTGDDIAGPDGQVVVAPLTGRVSRVWWDKFSNGTPAGGHMIEIDHGGGWLTRYAHLATKPSLVVGTVVSAGDVIGYVGSSGSANGPHLHWELLVNGKFVSPIDYVVVNKIKERVVIDSMFAYVGGVPSWCWMNYATGKIVAVYTQKEADYIGRYMGSVNKNFSGDKDRGEQRYNDQYAFFKLLV